MKTLKTAVVVVTLLAVLYGVYQTLHRPPVEESAEGPETAGLEIDPGSPTGLEGDAPWSPEGAAPWPAPPDFAAREAPLPDSGASPTEVPADGAYYAAQPADGPADNGYSAYPEETADAGGYRSDPGLLTSSGVAPASGSTAARAFHESWRLAGGLVAEGRYADALRDLTIYYGSPDLSEQEHAQLLDALDALAGVVVYSREHTLEPPAQVRRGETLFDVADRYGAPWELLARINEVRDPEVLLPGDALKVLRGPFRAEVHLARGELTLFLNEYYAGRFPVCVGASPAPLPGKHYVRDKRPGREFFAADGGTIPAGSPDNPYGRCWIDLGGEVCLHGSPEGAGPDPTRCCLGLTPQDEADVLSILSVDSQVLIR